MDSHSRDEATGDCSCIITEDEEDETSRLEDWLQDIRDMANMERFASSVFAWDEFPTSILHWLLAERHVQDVTDLNQVYTALMIGDTKTKRMAHANFKLTKFERWTTNVFDKGREDYSGCVAHRTDTVNGKKARFPAVVKETQMQEHLSLDVILQTANETRDRRRTWLALKQCLVFAEAPELSQQTTGENIIAIFNERLKEILWSIISWTTPQQLHSTLFPVSEHEVDSDDGRELDDRMDTYEDSQGEHRENSADDLNRVFKSESIVHSDDDELSNGGKIQRENRWEGDEERRGAPVLTDFDER
ncbi:hypothetical protein MMC27_006507 [Xylographa pallens]|nr:hypothetical protein [Xylographa pallens]